MDKLAQMLEPIDDAYTPSTRGDIVRLQTMLGAELPRQYADFLLRFGRCGFAGNAGLAGHPDLLVFTLFGTNGDAGNVFDDLTVHDDYLSRKLIPIADDMFNNRYVLQAPEGGVLFFDYTAGVVTERPVALSFEDFVGRIQVAADDDASS